MKFICSVLLGIAVVLVIFGMRIHVYEPSNFTDSSVCHMDCVQWEVTTNMLQDSAVVRFVPHIVLSFEVYEDGHYDVYYGNRNGATNMRSGQMDNNQWDLMKTMLWRDVSPFWRRGWRMEMAVATNSVVCLSQSDLEGLRYAVSNAIPNGCSMLIDDVNPLIWNFLSSADSNQFWKKKEWMR